MNNRTSIRRMKGELSGNGKELTNTNTTKVASTHKKPISWNLIQEKLNVEEDGCSTISSSSTNEEEKEDETANFNPPISISVQQSSAPVSK